VAQALRSTPASVNSALQRARKTVDERVPERNQQAAVRSIGDKQVRAIVDRFTDAFERRDTAAILALLAENAASSIPAYAS
jgi:RNA polymerase sigma-70 factor, ECF subfamily